MNSICDSPKANIMVLKESSSSSSPPLGGTVNLILSFGNTGDSQVQVLDLPAGSDQVVEETSEPVHRVRSTLSTLNLHSFCYIFFTIIVPEGQSSNIHSL